MSKLKVNELESNGAAGIGIGGPSTEPSAITNFQSTTQGILLPRMTQAQRDLIASPAQGLVIFNTDRLSYEQYTGTKWQAIGGSADIQNVIRVKKNTDIYDGDFNTITDALASITDNSVTNPYLIQVGPGIFIEDTLTMKPFVYVRGSGSNETIIQVNGPNKHVVVGADNSNLTECMVTGASGAGYAGIYYASSTIATTKAFYVRNCHLGENDTLVINDSTNGYTATFVEDCKFGGTYLFNTGFLSKGTQHGELVAKGCMNVGDFSSDPADIFVVDGSDCHLTITGVRISNTSLLSTNAIRARNGGMIHITATTVTGFSKGLWSENVGAAPAIYCGIIVMSECTQDLIVDHPGTIGSIFGSMDFHKVSVNANSTLGINFVDNSNDFIGDVTIGAIYQGDNFNRLIALSDIVRDGASLGLGSGGNISIHSGLTIDIALGSGYVLDSVGNFLKQVTWGNSQLILSANSSTYIIVDNSGTVTTAFSLPDPAETIIILGRVVTTLGSVLFIDSNPSLTLHLGTNLNQVFRDGLGVVYAKGSILSENGTRGITVSPGEYYFGAKQFFPSGGIGLTFKSFYLDNLGNPVILTAQTQIDNAQYNDTTAGTLTAITPTFYAKHSVYTVGDGVNEQYFVVYAQSQNVSLAVVEQEPLSLPPNYFIDGVSLIASIVVQGGTTNFVEVRDERPTLAHTSAGISAAVFHSNLLGLTADDHLQYLNRSGVRPMTGDLSLGTHNITNLGTANGVTVETHASRHLPSGADPITTAAPSTNLDSSTANGTGSANSLAKSDHSHAISTGAAAAQSPDQVNAAGSSANLAKSDHIHNIPTDTAVGLDTTSTSTQGSAVKFARANHTHAIASGSPSGQAPDQANAAGSSTNFAKADHIHNIPTDTAVGLDSTSTSTQGNSTKFARANHTHAIASGAPSTQAPDQANAAGSSANFAKADHIHNIPTAIASTSSTSSANASGSASSFSHSDHVHAITIATSAVSYSSPITTISPSDAVITGMTLTPAAGIYIVNFSGTFQIGVAGQIITLSCYVGGSQQADTIRRFEVTANGFGTTQAGLSFQKIVTVNGSQAIAAEWNTSTGTGTTAAGILNLIRVG